MAGARRSLRQVRRLERLLVHVLATRACVPWARRTEPLSASRTRRKRFPMRTGRFPRRRRGRLVPAHPSRGSAVSRTGSALEAGRRFAGVVDLVLLRSEGIPAHGHCVRPCRGGGERSKAGEGACARGLPVRPAQDPKRLHRNTCAVSRCGFEIAASRGGPRSIARLELTPRRETRRAKR